MEGLGAVHSRKKCIVKSGKKAGKLKKGYRFTSSGRCTKAKKKTRRSRR